ncbi:hypothetical protein GCM10007301_52880 [Azorhizobium oxalatiphilum]|uniref:Sulfotransferase family protein n=1 Tax=Azorhizobium oxalatiphilum TaxID=980631 RepID=A0A917CEE9_9HYPH|nr:sulfotransferase family 2 domain-containing protein [Azorhizobium oxalatiphilum]GGF86444.1 hypothetical protein GCM10007301_52880 [Azorhizobium oxalatiphilum]
MRFVILHHHIFKNAGTSLDSSLAHQFGADFTTLERNGELIPPDVLATLLRDNPQLKAVSSHSFMGQGFRDVEQALDLRFFHMALLRRPWDRLVSMYNFYQRAGLDDVFCRSARDMSIDVFVKWVLRHYPNQINSPQVNIFGCGGFYGRPIIERDVEAAWAIYREFALCGPMERYDEAMVVLEYFNSPVYMPRGLRMEYILRNRSTHTASVPRLKAMLSLSELDIVNELIRHDETLWTLADQELSRRVALVPDFAGRLADFRLRCDYLRGGGKLRTVPPEKAPRKQARA